MLSHFHPLCDGEIARLPETPGVYLMFQLQVPLQVDGALNLRLAVQRARSQFPRATHFSVETVSSAAELADQVEKRRHELRLVRTATLVGPWRTEG
jgi:hypothetical protein